MMARGGAESWLQKCMMVPHTLQRRASSQQPAVSQPFLLEEKMQSMAP